MIRKVLFNNRLNIWPSRKEWTKMSLKERMLNCLGCQGLISLWMINEWLILEMISNEQSLFPTVGSLDRPWCVSERDEAVISLFIDLSSELCGMVGLNFVTVQHLPPYYYLTQFPVLHKLANCNYTVSIWKSRMTTR